MNYSTASRYLVLSIFLLHSTSVQSYNWSCFSWTSMCATISALSYKAKAALLLTAAVITRLVYKEKKPLPPRRRSLARSEVVHIHIDPAENMKLDNELPEAEQKIIQGSEGIIRALIDNEPSDRIIPLIENTTPEELNTQAYNGHLALVCACSEERLDIAQALVKQGALINLPDKRNWTPLFASLKAYNQSYHKRIVQYLLDNDADPHNYTSSSPGANNLLIERRKLRFTATCIQQANNTQRNIRRRSIGGPCTNLIQNT